MSPILRLRRAAPQKKVKELTRNAVHGVLIRVKEDDQDGVLAVNLLKTQLLDASVAREHLLRVILLKLKGQIFNSHLFRLKMSFSIFLFLTTIQILFHIL